MSLPGDGFPDDATLTDLLERVTPLTGVEHLEFYQKLVEATVPPAPTPVTLPVTLGPAGGIFGGNTNVLRVTDGTQFAPLGTGEDFYSPSVMIERWDSANITGGAATGIAALLVEHSTTAPGMSDVNGEFIAIHGVASMYNFGPPASHSLHVGVKASAYVSATANHAAAFGLGANAIIEAGAATHAQAYGIEVNLQNDAVNATTNPLDSATILTAGVAINSRGTKDDTVGLYIGAGAAGRFHTGLYVSGVKPSTGIGLHFVSPDTFAPPIKFTNSNAEPCLLSKEGAFFTVYGHTNLSIFALNCATGALFITDTSKAFPSGQVVTFGANDSGGAGFKVLRIPN